VTRFAIAAVVACVLHTAGVRAQVDPPAAPGAQGAARVCVLGDDDAGVRALIEALGARGIEAVPCDASTSGSWVIETRGLASGAAEVTLRSPGSLVWRPEVEVDRDADLAGRARAAALTAATLLRLILETEPAAAGTPAASPGEPAEPPRGAAAAEEEPPVWQWGLGLSFGADGNLGGSAQRRRVGFDLGLRAEVKHAEGVWLAAQLDWTIAFADRAEQLLLETATPRLIAGAALGTDVWSVRFGLGWAFQGWWTDGGVAPSGWRMGGAFVTSVCWRPLSWLAVGVEASVELYRTRVEIDYADDPVFGLDYWRWRAGAWIAVTFGEE
jgi:hypothetical protein